MGDRELGNGGVWARGWPRRVGWAILLLACLLVLEGCLPSRRIESHPALPTAEPAIAGPVAARPAEAPATVAAKPPPPRPAEAAGVNKRGVHLLLDDGAVRWPDEVWQEHIAWAASLTGRGGHVVQLIRSDDLDPVAWQPFFDGVAREGLVPIVRIATRKNMVRHWWTAPRVDDGGGRGYRAEANQLRLFFQGIAWKTDRVVVTVGNEPNRPDEWGGAPSPAAYARYLRDVGEALRAVSGVRVVVLNAALDPYAPSTANRGNASIDAERFMEGMVAEVPDIFERLDGWASHAYPLGPFGEHPGRQEFRIDDVRPGAAERPAPPFGLPNRGVNGYLWELWKLEQLGLRRKLPVYVTESGWRQLWSQAPSLDAANAVLHPDWVAGYVGLAYEGPTDAPAQGWIPWNDDPRVVSASLFALGGWPTHWGHSNLVQVDHLGRIIGIFPVAERLSAVRPARPGPPGATATP